MHYSENYHLNKPDLADQYNVSHWNENTDAIDSAMQNIRNGMDATMKATLLNFCYPIGSIYWSSNSTNPATLFGGTWVQIKDKFVWAKGDSDTVDSTGGAKTVTLTANNLPEHTHNFTPQGTVSRHEHKLNDGNTSSDGTIATAGFRGVEVSTSENGNHHHTYQIPNEYNVANGSNAWKYHTMSGNTLNTSDAGSHTHTVTPNGYIYGSTDSAQPTFTGTEGTTANNTTTNVAVDKMPPYVVKYCWERTA